ncbi:hypothetical protein ACKLNO_00710 [Neisseriaceae bacterium B1]
MERIGSHFRLELDKFLNKTNIAPKLSLAPRQPEKSYHTVLAGS